MKCAMIKIGDNMEENKNEIENLFDEEEVKEVVGGQPEQTEVAPTVEQPAAATPSPAAPTTVAPTAPVETPQIQIEQPAEVNQGTATPSASAPVENAPAPATNNEAAQPTEQPAPTTPSAPAAVPPTEPKKEEPKKEKSKKEKIELVVFIILVIIFILLLLKTFVFTGNKEQNSGTGDNGGTVQPANPSDGLPSDAELITMGTELYNTINDVVMLPNTAVGCQATDSDQAVVFDGRNYGKVDYGTIVPKVTSEFDAKLRTLLEIKEQDGNYYIPCQSSAVVKNPNYKETNFVVANKTADVVTFTATAKFCGCGEDGVVTCDSVKESPTTFVIKSNNGSWLVDQMVLTQYSDCNGVIDKFTSAANIESPIDNQTTPNSQTGTDTQIQEQTQDQAQEQTQTE